MNTKRSRSPAIVSYMFYLYLAFLTARSFAYPQDIPLHMIAGTISLLIYLTFYVEPSFLKSFISKAENYISKNINRAIFIPIFLIAFLGAIYSFFPNPFSVDENGNLKASGYILEKGLYNFFKDYELMQWVGNQHPFLVPLINSLAFRIFGVHLYVARLITLIFSMLTLFFVYLLGRELFDRQIGFFSAAFLLLSQIYFRTSCAALMDVQVTFFFALASWLFLRYLKTHALRYAILCGMSIGPGLLTKYSMAFIYPIIFLYLMVTRKISEEIKNIGIWIILLMSIGMVTPWLIYLWQSGVFGAQYNWISFCIGRIWTHKIFIVSRFLFDCLPSGIGGQNIPFLLMGLFGVLKDRSNSGKFILSWVFGFFIIVPLLFDIRHTLPAYPALAILMAYGLKAVSDNSEKIKLLLLSASYLSINLVMYLFVSPSSISRFKFCL